MPVQKHCSLKTIEVTRTNAFFGEESHRGALRGNRYTFCLNFVQQRNLWRGAKLATTMIVSCALYNATNRYKRLYLKTSYPPLRPFSVEEEGRYPYGSMEGCNHPLPDLRGRRPRPCKIAKSVVSCSRKAHQALSGTNCTVLEVSTADQSNVQISGPNFLSGYAETKSACMIIPTLTC